MVYWIFYKAEPNVIGHCGRRAINNFSYDRMLVENDNMSWCLAKTEGVPLILF